MLALIVVTASLLVQAYVFRVTPSHPADPCAADQSLCPEAGLDSLFASRERTLESMRRIAQGRDVPGEADPSTGEVTVSEAAPIPRPGL
jgi:hypothetical protein